MGCFLNVAGQRQRRPGPEVPPGSTENAASHHPPLLQLQVDLGLGYSRAHLLHGCDGSVQRCLPGKDDGQRSDSGDRQRRRCRLLR